MNELRSQQAGASSLRAVTSTRGQTISSISVADTLEQSTVATTIDERAQAEITEMNTVSEALFSDMPPSTTAQESVVLPKPPIGHEEGPFECPLCFSILVAANTESWSKHLHADLASYTCTFGHCNQTHFQSRNQWYQHEMEVHRRWWACPLCNFATRSSRDFELHAINFHELAWDDAQIFSSLNSEVLQQIPTSDCPFCDYGRTISTDQRSSSTTTIAAKRFMHHVGRHLEMFALFALPRSEHTISIDDRSDSDRTSLGSGASEDDSKPTQSKGMPDLAGKSPEEILAVVGLQGGPPFELLKHPPRLALGWQPPEDFTPPKQDFDTNDSEKLPTRQESMFGGDLFTPGWARGSDFRKEAYCGRCEVGHWVNVPNGSYEFHLTYLHGLASNGLPIPRPASIRRARDDPLVWEGYCKDCQSWKVLKKTSQGWNWFRHYLTEHKFLSGAGEESSGSTLDAAEHADHFAQALDHVRREQTQSYKEFLHSQPQLVRQEPSHSKTLLHYAAEVGNRSIVQMTLETCKSLGAIRLIDQADDSGFTPMMLAAGQGCHTVIEPLLESGADIYAATESGLTALDFAINAGFYAVAKVLLDAGADVASSAVFAGMHSQRSKQRDLPVLPLASLSVVDEEIEGDQNDVQGWNEVLLGASTNDVEQVKHALNVGQDIESRTADGRNALMVAASCNNEAVVNYLISTGASVDATDDKGWTALIQAANHGNLSLTQLLLSRGADVHHLSPDHRSAISEASQAGHAEILQALLDADADPESRSPNDWTPLMHASWRGEPPIVDALLKSGAKPDCTSQRYESPLLLAAANGHTAVCRILLLYGARAEAAWAGNSEGTDLSSYTQTSLERTTLLGWTPLMVACQGGHIEIVQLLLDAGANSSPMSPFEKTAMSIAMENGRSEIVDLMMAYTRRAAQESSRG